MSSRSREHEIRDSAASPMVLAPWAITQLRHGGVAVVPDPPRGNGPQADRSIVFWPYADPGDPRQVYVCDAFCELETVGVLRTLEPGQTASHRERWTLILDPDHGRSTAGPEEP